MTDTSNIIRVLQEVQPDEVYNLGAQSHVAVSFEIPEYTANTDAMGPLRLDIYTSPAMERGLGGEVGVGNLFRLRSLIS